jgi:hypothetical protein
MSSNRFARIWEHASLWGDSMLLVVPMSLALTGLGMSAFALIGLGGVGFVLSLVLAPAGAVALAMKLHGRTVDRNLAIDAAVATLAVSTVGGGLYAFVVTQGFDRSASFSTMLIVLLAIETVLFLALAADSAFDWSRRRTHTTLDTVRLLAAVPVLLSVAVFATNPDFGEFVVVAAPVAMAGAIAGVIGDMVNTARSHPAPPPSRHAHPVAM